MLRWTGHLRDVALLAGAVVGVLTAVWFVFSQATGAQLVAVRTGSMTPTIPVGSLVVAMPAAVDDLEVGDVVTTRLDDASPLITHRVARIELVDGQPELILKGDANDTEDLYGYHVERVLREVVSINHGATVLDRLHDKRATVLVALLVGGLIAWALWPSRPREGRAACRQ